MFDSRQKWASAGFSVLDRSNDKRIMAAQHPCVPGVLFKKYNSTVDIDQRNNYVARVEGADCLRAFIFDHQLQHIVVPRKQVIDLPVVFSSGGQSSQVLAVEKFDLIELKATIKCYRDIDLFILREVCFVLFHFRGLDSIVDNLPFTTEGKVAFIDTERWRGGRRRPYLRHLRRYLTSDRRKIAKKLFRQFQGGRLDIGADDFLDEEDTSSWSLLSSS